MKSSNISGLFITTALVTALHLPSEAQADPTVEVHYDPEYAEIFGGETPKIVDCATLDIIDGEAYMTYEFAEQVDVEGYELGTDPQDNASDEDKKHSSTQALRRAIQHAARPHNDCLAAAGVLQLQVGQDPARLYGSDWQNQKSCRLLETVKACKVEMGLD